MDYQFQLTIQTIEDVDREYEKTSQEIQRLQEHLQELRTYRNQLIPISRLPVETLAEIFQLTQTSPFDSENHSCGRVAMTVASVCRHWRHVVVSTPLLWNTIDITNVPWIRCSLERSRNLPLVVDVNLGQILGKTASDILSVTLRDLPRIKSATFRAACDLAGLQLNVEWSKYAHSLETLVLHDIDISSMDSRPPVLRTLSLNSCLLDWDNIPSSPHLRKLHINDPETCGTTKDILRYLKATPSIEDLKLKGALIDEELLDLQDSDRVLLPHLRYMHIEGLVDDVEPPNFFSGIAIPSTAKLYVDIDTIGYGYGLPTESLTAIHSCRSTPWNPVVLLISMKRLWMSLKIHEDAKAAEESPTLHFVFEGILGANLVEDACAVLHLTNLSILDITAEAGDLITSSTLWSDAFGQLPNLRVLKARGDTAPSLVEFLCTEATEMTITTGTQPESPSFSFPALEVLALEGCSLASYQSRAVVFALETRRNHNHRLQRLIFYMSSDQRCNKEDEAILWKFSHLADAVEQLEHSEF